MKQVHIRINNKANFRKYNLTSINTPPYYLCSLVGGIAKRFNVIFCACARYATFLRGKKPKIDRKIAKK